MSLFQSINEVKKYVRISGSDDAKALPNSRRTEAKYVVPIIGRELYADTVKKYLDGSTEAVHLDLLELLQAAIAPLMYWQELPMINTQITGAGLRKTSTENSVPVFKHDFNNLSAALLNQGMEALEALLEFLEKHAADYPKWTASDEYNAYKKYVIRSGTAFDGIYKLYQPRRCYLALMPGMAMVEDFYIVPTVGEAFLNELKGKTAPTAQEQEALKLASKAIANLTIHHSINTLTVRVTDSGFTVQLADPDLAESSQEVADDTKLEKLRQETERIGQAYLSRLVDYLNENASSTVFTTFYNSPLYKDPKVETPSINSTSKSTFSFL